MDLNVKYKNFRDKQKKSLESRARQRVLILEIKSTIHQRKN